MLAGVVDLQAEHAGDGAVVGHLVLLGGADDGEGRVGAHEVVHKHGHNDGAFDADTLEEDTRVCD